MKRLLLALLLAPLAAAAAAPTEFEGMDADRDGRISAAEHAAGAKKMFRTMDANRDGKVTALEMDAAHQSEDHWPEGIESGHERGREDQGRRR